MEQVLFYFSRAFDELAPEPAIRSFETGQRIHCFDSCQLTLIWIPYGGVLLISSDGADRRNFGGEGRGVKIFDSRIFWVGKFGKQFFGWLDLSMDI